MAGSFGELVVRSEEEVDDLSNRVSEVKDTVGTKWKGMTFEDGIRSTIDWLVGDQDEDPLED